MTRYALYDPTSGLYYRRAVGKDLRLYQWVELGQGETLWEYMTLAIYHAEYRGLSNYEIRPVRI